MAPRIIKGTTGLKEVVGEHVGHSEWVTITQEQVDQFAEATGDHQWIHVDPERAKKESPFGAPIAHGYLTLSLLPVFAEQIYSIEGLAFGMNYGANKLRFPSPVPVGCRVRGGAEITAVEDIPGGLQTTISITIQVEGRDKPACVIESLSRWLA